MSETSEEQELLEGEELSEEEEQECTRLQQNDPMLSIVSIDNLDNNKARRYGLALQHNSFVNDLTILTAAELTL
jgi:hypothetical protein